MVEKRMATIKDVAEHAGVSRSTVSYVLSGKRSISETVKRRVEAAIDELEYTPSSLGLNLRQGKSQTIGMVYPLSDVRLEFVRAAAAVLQDRYTLSLLTHTDEAAGLVAAFKQRRIDGLILMQVRRHDNRVEGLRGSAYPFVLIGRPEDAKGLSFVDFDFRAAAYLATQHLVGLGHKVVGYITYPRDKRDLELGYLLQLERGYKQAQRDFGVKIVVQEADSSIAACAQATEVLVTGTPELTAIVALDVTAQVGAHMGLLRALYVLGKRVPEDLSVVCFTAPEVAEWTVPKLTSVELPFAEMGRIGAELMLKRLSGGADVAQIVLPARLEARESTAPPNSRK